MRDLALALALAPARAASLALAIASLFLLLLLALALAFALACSCSCSRPSIANWFKRAGVLWQDWHQRDIFRGCLILFSKWGKGYPRAFAKVQQ